MTKYYSHYGLMPAMLNPMRLYSVVDRTRAMIDIKDIEIFSPIGSLCQPKSIEEICYNRVKHIMDRTGTGRIYVAWSGGIDSTLALSEFIKIAPHSQITVMMTHNSINEYPAFYKRFIENKLDTCAISFYNDDMLKSALTDGVIVTGVGGIDGGSGAGFAVDILYESIDKMLTKVNDDTRIHYLNLINACPRKLVNTKDFLWWLEYALNWQNAEFQWLSEVDELILEKNIFHFGDGPEWHNYAVSTPDEVKHPGPEIVNFKMPIKQHLYTFTKDADYTANKIKTQSWRRYRTPEQRTKQKAIYITTNWERGYGVEHIS